MLVYVSTSPISWWDAVSACEAKGNELGKNMSLVSVSDLVSDWDGSIPQVCTRTQFAEALHKDIWNSYSELKR